MHICDSDTGVALNCDTCKRLEKENARLKEIIEQLEWDLADMRQAAIEYAARVCDGEQAKLLDDATKLDAFHALTAQADANVYSEIAKKLRASK